MDEIKPMNRRAVEMMARRDQVYGMSQDIPSGAECSTVFYPGWETSCWGGIVRDLTDPFKQCTVAGDLVACHAKGRHITGDPIAYCWWPNQVPDTDTDIDLATPGIQKWLESCTGVYPPLTIGDLKVAK